MGNCARCNKDRYSFKWVEGEGYICTSCLNMESFKAGKPGFFLCPICGEADNPKDWSTGLPRGLCFSCSFWAEIKEAYDRGEKIVVKGHAYQVGREDQPGSKNWRGFGGDRFVIKMLRDGRTFVSTNLWSNGEIPSRFRAQMPDNAEFVKRCE